MVDPALAARRRAFRPGARTAYVEKASPWENGYVESSNGKLRERMLNGGLLHTLREAQVLIDERRRHHTGSG